MALYDLTKDRTLVYFWGGPAHGRVVWYAGGPGGQPRHLNMLAGEADSRNRLEVNISYVTYRPAILMMHPEFQLAMVPEDLLPAVRQGPAGLRMRRAYTQEQVRQWPFGIFIDLAKVELRSKLLAALDRWIAEDRPARELPASLTWQVVFTQWLDPATEDLIIHAWPAHSRPKDQTYDRTRSNQLDRPPSGHDRSLVLRVEDPREY